MPLITQEARHAWMTELPQEGLVVSPVVMDDVFPEICSPTFWAYRTLRDRYAAFVAHRSERKGAAGGQPLSAWLDAVFEDFLGHARPYWRKGADIPDALCLTTALGERIRPQRVLFCDGSGAQPAFLVLVDTAERLGAGRSRSGASRLVELCRACDVRLAILTNGSQIRLYYVGMDHVAWIEWDIDAWFQEGELRHQLDGFLTLLGPNGIRPRDGRDFRLLDAALESRSRQSDLSATLSEQVREAIEMLLAQVDIAKRQDPHLLDIIRRVPPAERGLDSGDAPVMLDDRQVRSALYQAATRVVMRLVVTLFAEARRLLPRDNALYRDSYGIEGLFEQLRRATTHGGHGDGLAGQYGAWPRILSLCALVYEGSIHEALTLHAYGGTLFASGEPTSPDAISRALSVIEHPSVRITDAVIYQLLRKLKIGSVRVRSGRQTAWVSGPVDFTDLRTEYIGIMYEGLLDYELREDDDVVVFLNVGDEPALPLSRLEQMSDGEIANLFLQLEKEAKGKTAAAEDNAETEEEASDEGDGEAEAETMGEDAGDDADENADTADVSGADIDGDESDGATARSGPEEEARIRALDWARRAVVATKRVKRPRGKYGDYAFERSLDAAARRLIRRSLVRGEFYLVRGSGTRKGSGTFYTKPALAVPTVIRTLGPLVYDAGSDGSRIPKSPETILQLKIVDPACGSASFLVAALHFLTDALWHALLVYNQPQGDSSASGRYIRPVHAAKLTLLQVPGSDKPDEIDEYPDTDAFERKARARLRRYVVERCIYGVDINPLAVELARLSLWIETLDPDLPFSFLDHKIKVGNALVGAWLDTFQEYPLLAWAREGGDKTHVQGVHFPQGAWTQQIKGTLEDRVKPELRQLIQLRTGQQVLLGMPQLIPAADTHTAIRQALDQIHKLPLDDTGMRLRAEQYHELRARPDFHALKDSMDLWCALWFWPADQIDLAPTPATYYDPEPSAYALARGLAVDLRFFHWEIEFPDVFTEPGSGFNAVVGNPPWEVVKPDSREFFVRVDPIYRTYNKQDALEQQRSLFAREKRIEQEWLEYNGRLKALSNWAGKVAHPWGDPEAAGERVMLSRGDENAQLHATWRRERSMHVDSGRSDQNHPFRYQGSADLNSYKQFAEIAYALLQQNGRFGLILPSSIGSDNGSRMLRELFLERCQWEWSFNWINWNKIFAIYYRFKFCAVVVTKGGITGSLRAAFSRVDAREWEEAEKSPGLINLSADTVRRLSPQSLALLEPGTPRDLALLERLYSPPAILLGSEGADGWQITYASEFHMTNDSKLFHPRIWWEDQGYQPDSYGSWRDDQDNVALPLYEGRMVSQFDFSEKGWVSGVGRKAVWRPVEPDAKTLQPQYLMQATEYMAHLRTHSNGIKVAMMNIGSATNARSMISSLVPSFPCAHSLAVLGCQTGSMDDMLRLITILNSFPYDFALRMRLGGLNLSYFVLAETPLLLPEVAARYPLARWAAQLTLIHSLWAREWLDLQQTYPELGSRPWRSWWATTHTERLRLRCMIDAVVAAAWGLSEEDMAWMLRDDPSDPKGFWRVDKDLPPEERQTTLMLAAFRDLQSLGIERFCQEEWWGVPGCHRPPDHWESDEVTQSWEECEQHAHILAATDPVMATRASADTRPPDEDSGLWVGAPEQKNLPGMGVPIRQMRLDERQ